MRTPVFHSFPKWQLSGVNTWSINLAEAMKNDPEFEHIMLITGVAPVTLPELDARGISYEFLDVPSPRKRKDEWNSLKAFLEKRTPCIYIPNYDFHRSCAVGSLSSAVKVCAVIHSDEECYYDEVRRLGKYFDAVVTVSSHLQQNLACMHPELRDRLKWIPHGVPSPNQGREVGGAWNPVKLLYCNRLSQYQKRVFDLPEVCRELLRLGADFELVVAGGGPDEQELGARFGQAGLGRNVRMVGLLTNEEAREAFLSSDVFLLTSDFEGLPISLLESMAAGCVPVVYDIDSGVRDAIEDGVNGIFVPHGDFANMARVIAGLSKDRRRLDALSSECVRSHAERFSVDSMASAYRSLCKDLIGNKQPLSQRDGRIRIPKDLSVRARVLRRLAVIHSRLLFMNN